jgi:hypothetical protein
MNTLLLCALTFVALTQETARLFLLQVQQAHVGLAIVNDIEAVADGFDAIGQRRTVRYIAQGSKTFRVERGEGLSQTVSVYSNGSGWQVRDGKTDSFPDHITSQRLRLFPFLDLISEAANPKLEIVVKENSAVGPSTTCSCV